MPKNQEITLKPTTISHIFLFLKELAIIATIILFIAIFIVIPFRIEGESMEGNFHSGEYILVDKFSYLKLPTHFLDWKGSENFFIKKWIAGFFEHIPIHIGDPQRGDVVVLRPHIDRTAKFYLKRVIGLPGETIKITNGEVFIKPLHSNNFIKISEPYLLAENTNNTNLPLNIKETEFTIPEGNYWVMGDNRRNSSDSRNCFWICEAGEHSHFIERHNIIGKVIFSFGNFNIFENFFPPKLGNFSWNVKPQGFPEFRTAQYPELE